MSAARSRASARVRFIPGKWGLQKGLRLPAGGGPHRHSEVILSRPPAGVALMHGKVPGFGGHQGTALRRRLSRGPGGGFCLLRLLAASRSSGPRSHQLDGRRRRLLCSVRRLCGRRRAAHHRLRLAGDVPGGTAVPARCDAQDHDGDGTVPEPVHHQRPGSRTGGAGRPRGRPGVPGGSHGSRIGQRAALSLGVIMGFVFKADRQWSLDDDRALERALARELDPELAGTRSGCGCTPAARSL
ncbi:hypothetical protein AHiyo4_28360 [Arthrobacter sp. Hiyo4]|nr:hypothetical protein AHiyo4_28360 [Arthrobacter sp. Hiyo4]